ncbi:proline:sodium symporter PutP [Piscirickettsia salmonis]|uniref:Sodium/proline symporter n=1 Tax=Piscirickettsia salmonis TaxID=1238 RepID=A0A9Q5VD41_PISSA|nr:sodium/proline symporter PutP [Piscirickettsia salmonis]ALA24402.1 sodium/proline symporter [Piscirickettsia salmonis]APS44768.1 proline:sodium symporter PutP [Piscirickettsia salmonis]APS48127.1 proline:sodium symporter PutP [Piscirickettsia salmonis]APS52084.1 proline:sodium symporter PutP [Piscirickettsia salmonis]APS55302.1 proline:sodium symporter PutP [Piscirickettsia salmonis]
MYELIATFTLYILVIFAIGLYSYFSTRNLTDYMLGGRTLSGAIAALGAGASDMSSWLLLALPGAVMLHGLNQIWLPIGLSLGAYLNWQFIAKRLRIYTEIAKDAITIPAYLEHRFHDTTKILRSATAIVVLTFFTFYTAAGFVSGGLLFSSTFHIDYSTGLIITAAIIVIYTCVGGFLAIAWVDFFQGTLMFFALLIVPAVALHHLGGISTTLHIIDSQSSFLLNAFHGTSALGTFSLLAWGLGYFGQPHILVRFMATKTHKDIPKAQFICMTWMNFALYGAIFTGLFSIAFFAQTPLANPETAFLQLAKTLFNPWVAGILLAAVFSATMSTSSAQLLASASALAEDCYHRFLRPQAKARELLNISRIGVILITCIAFALAFNPQSSILNLVGYAWAGLGAAFGPVILISLFWRRMNLPGAIAGILIGALVVIIWPHLHNLGSIFTIYELLPAFILSVCSIIIVSLTTTPPHVKIYQEFDQTLAILNTPSTVSGACNAIR